MTTAPQDEIEILCSNFAGKKTHIETDFKTGRLKFSAGGTRCDLGFERSKFKRTQVEAGGWTHYTEAR